MFQQRTPKIAVTICALCGEFAAGWPDNSLRTARDSPSSAWRGFRFGDQRLCLPLEFGKAVSSSPPDYLWLDCFIVVGQNVAKSDSVPKFRKPCRKFGTAGFKAAESVSRSDETHFDSQPGPPVDEERIPVQSIIQTRDLFGFTNDILATVLTSPQR